MAIKKNKEPEKNQTVDGHVIGIRVTITPNYVIYNLTDGIKEYLQKVVEQYTQTSEYTFTTEVKLINAENEEDENKYIKYILNTNLIDVTSEHNNKILIQ